MKLTTVFLIIASIASAQTLPVPPPPLPGIVLVNYNTTIQITAGGLKCTAQTANAGLNISIYCYVGTKLVINSSLVIDTISTADNGVHWKYGVKGDLISVVIYRPEAINQIAWQVNSNGTAREGTFAASN